MFDGFGSLVDREWLIVWAKIGLKIGQFSSSENWTFVVRNQAKQRPT